MKNIILSITALFIYFAFAISANAQTIITSPLDSRPISIEYLSNLAKIAGDELISADKSSLDYFSAIDKNNYYGNSEKTRQDIYDLVSQNNNENTTVIINTSSYITKGLVGSRCGDHYLSYTQALDDLYKLTSENTKPTYYVNLSMPRTLPETRGNQIWPNNEKQLGLIYYYRIYNPDFSEAEAARLSRVTPSQFLLEWNYVQNKKSELGEDSLAPWEKDFLRDFNVNYRTKEPYVRYTAKYRAPFRTVTAIFYRLMKMQDAGLIDEIIISNDDFQLPDSITYLYNNTKADWIPVENGNPIKFSFARTYMTTGGYSVYKLLSFYKGSWNSYLATKGLNDNINFVFGLDEIPQLIYARDVSKRHNLNTSLIPISTANTETVAKFDVLSVNKLLSNDINFVKRGSHVTNKKFVLYLYDYGNTMNFLPEYAYDEMNKKYAQGNNIGLIEIYNSTVSVTGENLLFKQLYNNSLNAKNTELSLTNLSCYSAWNTNANAIGLGVAHAQVYGIMEEKNNDTEKFLQSHINMLSQHFLEDGIYTVKIKRQLSTEPFVPTGDDLVSSKKLYDLLEPDKLSEAFKNTTYTIKNTKYNIKDLTLSKCFFPWGRIFECYLDFDVKIEKAD